MKKFLTALMCGIAALTMAFSLAACANSGGNDAGGNTQGGAETPGEAPEEWGSVLVVYYSATGNTERVAGYIAAATDGDMFELVPADPYTSADLNWNDDDSRVVREHENEDLQNSVELVAATPENWESYDTVFIGYPIWWGIAAWPVNGFVTANDFTGKTVVPFCTSSSSGLGNSERLLADMAGEGNWLEGQRFRSGASQDTVNDWLQELGVTG